MENSACAGLDRLFQIAQTGDAENLHKLILHHLSLTCTENPLHYASAAGDLDFVREILRLKPGFARELNGQGYSPMHLASANGNLQIVKEIIQVDPTACRVEGREGRTPLHLAVLKGQVDVISEMIANCEGCLEDVTVQNETALHLAVKNFQLGSFQVMLDWIRQKKLEGILSKKDEQGNTILHVATWKKQRKVLEMLLANGPGTIEVNAINKSGLTALDLLSIFPSEAGDREIQEILKGAGASKAQDLALHITIQTTPARENTSNNPPSKLVDYFKFHDGRDSPGDVRSTLLVIAVLVATATYQVGISPPGGLWQDNDQGRVAGTSIMGTRDMVSYIILVASNSVGFCVSLYMIGTLTSKFPLQVELQICLFALYVTYNVAVTSVAPKHAKIFINVFTSILPSALPWVASLLRKYRVDKQVVGMFRKLSVKIRGG